MPLTLKLFMVYVTSFLGPHLACHMQLEAGDRDLGTGYIYELYITSLSLSCLFVAIETGGRGVVKPLL